MKCGLEFIFQIWPIIEICQKIEIWANNPKFGQILIER